MQLEGNWNGICEWDQNYKDCQPITETWFLLRLAVICPGIEYTQGKNLICLSDGHEEKSRLISAL